MSANPNCLCQNCSFVLALPSSQINTGAHNLSKLKGHQVHCNKIQYSISKSPEKKTQTAFNTISSCVTCLKETHTAKLIQPVPRETLGLTLARPTSAHCFGSNLSVSSSVGPENQMTESAYSQSSYQNPYECNSWTQKKQYCNSCFGSFSGAFSAVQKNQNLSQNLFRRTFTPDFTSMRRNDGWKKHSDIFLITVVVEFNVVVFFFTKMDESNSAYFVIYKNRCNLSIFFCNNLWNQLTNLFTMVKQTSEHLHLQKWMKPT